MKDHRHRIHFGLLPLFSLILFFALLINSAITVTTVYFLIRLGVLSVQSDILPHIGDLIQAKQDSK